jgi:cobalt-zinc-cadmium efflux system membrane fusion protein
MMSFRSHTAATPEEPGDRDGAVAVAVVALARLAVIAASLGLGCCMDASAEAPPKKSDSIQVTADQSQQLTVVKVETRPFRLEKSAVGQIAYNEDASTAVLTPFSGRVIRLVAKIGDKVARGAPLLEVDSPEIVQPQNDFLAAIASLNKARSQLNLATIGEKRNGSLYEGQAGALKDWQQAQAQLVGAQSDLQMAESAVEAGRSRLRILGLTDAEIAELQEKGKIWRSVPIFSPIDGTVVARKVRPGQFVRNDQGEQLYVIADLSTMWLKALVPEIDVPFIKIGQEVEVKVMAVPQRVFKARIVHVGALFDAPTRRMVVRSEVANPDGALKAEMFATFKIAIGASVPAPAVPMDAVIREGDLAAVWVQQAPMSFQRRMVKVGMEQDGQVEVRDGLKAGEFAVTKGAIFLDNEWRQ